jgi:hypothetical protein
MSGNTLHREIRWELGFPARKAKKIDGVFPNLLCRKFDHF